MIITELNKDNYLIFAIQNYNNPQAVTKDDFLDDMKRFKYIKRLLKRYKKSKTLKFNLLINHFIILYNIFNDAATPLLFYKIEEDLWSTMKTFILYLNKLPEYPKCFIHEIPIDRECQTLLEEIYGVKE
jgi:hypothetical protein